MRCDLCKRDLTDGRMLCDTCADAIRRLAKINKDAEALRRGVIRPLAARGTAA